ncbi:hypothetical protein ACI3L1_18375 [Deinococcus sp. SM5_A1]|uniref:hypothetical protein n=1 Tax=Deinococcus sp. SM5_A1 TaxID=3379094 RepID=UPI0038593C81
MPENKYTVQPDLPKLLNLLDTYLKAEEKKTKKEFVFMSDPAFPALLVFAERARHRLVTLMEQRLEVAVLLGQAKRETANNLRSRKNRSRQAIPVVCETEGIPSF